ncbi:MAG: DUF3795 domain-containing protein [Candidatus Latescibacteria bacterium]|nr:DUF3795 domain-containing protein [Candidatus Latescibacterota bacterium]
MKEIVADTSLIAYCGLYCGACKKYLKEKCPGCPKNEKASWCKIRQCCMEHSYKSCADCQIVSTLNECKKLNNMISKFFEIFFHSDRLACLISIKNNGYETFAHDMSKKQIMTIRK